MDKIYTDLSLLRQVSESLAPIKIPLNSHNEIFTTQVNGMLPNRILVLGRGGSGKSTLIAKIAYDWSHGVSDSSVKDISLLFALNMRRMTKNTTLEEAILDQLLPRDTAITKESLINYIDSNPSDVIILLDSYDEFSRGEKLTSRGGKLPISSIRNMYIRDILAYNRLTSSRVLVTSRHWREFDFSNLQSLYVKMEVIGFSLEKIRNYVLTYFQGSEESGVQLISYIESHDLFGIASCPLMTQLLCLFWQHNEGQTIPTRIQNFKIMLKHCRLKGTMKNSLPFEKSMVCLGEVAFRGLWPPENRLVFSLQEVNEITSNQCVDDGCKTGIISIEQNGKLSSFEQAMSQHSNEEKSVMFFHKTGQEKCAGEYLSEIASKDPDELKARLNQLKTPKNFLSVQMILRFACGSSKQAAQLILQTLIAVANVIQQDLGNFFADELKEPLEAKLVQEFVELCLLCNYESDSEGQFNSILLQLFASRKLHFLGTAYYTNAAVGYFLSWIKDKSVIDYIKITQLPGHGETLGYGVANIVDTLLAKIRQEIRVKPLVEVQNVVTEYLDKNKENIDLTTFINHAQSGSSLHVLGYIQMWEYFSTWFSSDNKMNINPILVAVKYISLRQLHLSNVDLSSSGQILIDILEQGHMSSLTHLKLASTKLRTHQLTHLATLLSQAAPMLQVLDIGLNKVDSPVTEKLSESLPKLALQELWLHGMYAPAKDANALAKRIPEFCSHLKVLHLYSNTLGNEAGLTLVKTLPYAYKLEDLSLDVDGMSKEVHRDLILTIGNLTRVHSLHVGKSEYPEDVILHMGNVLRSLSTLKRLFLVVSPSIVESHQSVISRSSWQVFISSLQPKAKHMVYLRLQHVQLHEEDLQQLLDLCRDTNMGIG